jgi:hypothetical protein
MIDPRIKFVDALLPAKQSDPCAELRFERDMWREIAERFYNATHEADYTVMMRAVKHYEEAASDE